MTVLEFFDKNPLENLVTTLTLRPDRVIFFGKADLMKQQREACIDLLKKKKINTEVIWQRVDCENLPLLIETLERTVAKEKDCVIDVTGGEDLVLVAAGAVYEKLRGTHNVQLQRFDLSRGRFFDCDGDEKVINEDLPRLSVEENIALRGGVVRYQSKEASGTEKWQITPELQQYTEILWNISRRDPAQWNSAISVLRGQEKRPDRKKSLQISINIARLKKAVEKSDAGYAYLHGVLLEMKNRALLTDFSETEEKITYRYRDEALYRLLSKAGNVLEVKILLLVLGMKNEDGSPWCTDAVNGVYIDWDGQLHTRYDEEKDTENEIDVLLMRDIFPVFISCKNGMVKEEELYKLSTVADRFGGKYTRRVLCATYLGKSEGSNAYLRQRAADMYITLIENIHTMSDEEIEARLRAACEI